MTFEQALALYAVMPAAERRSVVNACGLDMRTIEASAKGCGCWRCTKQRSLFITSVSAKADEIERAMLAAQREPLNLLADALVEDILQTPDNEILAEFTERHGDPAKNAADMRAIFELVSQPTEKRIS